MSLLRILGLAPSERDERIKDLISGSYASVEVVGRGTVQIDPREVRDSDEFQQARRQAKAIVRR
jgi:hypothetical protein